MVGTYGMVGSYGSDMDVVWIVLWKMHRSCHPAFSRRKV